jgi:hypothetical protein
MYIRTQNQDGGWGYIPGSGAGAFGGESKLSMTTAGLCGLLIAGMELNHGRELLQANGTAQNCGLYAEDEPTRKALTYIGKHFQVEAKHAPYYNLYGIERAGRLSGLRFFNDHDWYREGCEYLVKTQDSKGYWFVQNARWSDFGFRTINTAFALLFLSKGRTPVLISKLAHGPQPRGTWAVAGGQAQQQDWNNDRNDLRHLVEHASKHLFKRQPLAWQTFDMERALTAAQGPAVVLNDEDFLEITSELLQSPIAYITGHRSLVKGVNAGFTERERRLVREYVESGGFIFAEACCGSTEFDKGFHEFVSKVFEDELVDLPADHAVWTAFAKVKPGTFRLKGLQRGCRWALIYSRDDLSCRWETGKPDDPQCVMAFKMGLNIIAYATGNEPPQPRLTRVELAVIDDKKAADIPEGFLKIGQLNFKPGVESNDWKLAPKAMSNVLVHLHKTRGIDVAVKWEEVAVSAKKKIIDHKFIYMHGRKGFELPKGQLGDLRFNLEKGGLLFADACCGSKEFDVSFRAFIKDLLPNHKLEPIPPNDPLFSQELNRTALTAANIRARTEKKGGIQPVAPRLEGVKIDDRWAVIYSPIDIGCALERHQSPECLGYTPDSALRIASAAVLYQLTPDLKGP